MPPQLAVLHSEDIPDEYIEEFSVSVSANGLDFATERTSLRGPFAGIEWLLPTAVIVYITKAYFDGFLKEMGKDHYLLLKAGATALLGKVGKVRLSLVGSSGKVSSKGEYSIGFSIILDIGANYRLKLLVQNELTEEQAERVMSSFFDFAEQFHAGLLDARWSSSLSAVGLLVAPG
ncbi:MAG TPA: hypothetical protein VKY24_05745 [Reyranella sp.]|nr:hypothetical protein [Reyranella sp.]